MELLGLMGYGVMTSVIEMIGLWGYSFRVKVLRLGLELSNSTSTFHTGHLTCLLRRSLPDIELYQHRLSACLPQPISGRRAVWNPPEVPLGNITLTLTLSG